MAVTASAVSLPVHDPVAALGFCRDAPGLEVRSDDLDTTFEKVRASGAEVLQEPAFPTLGTRRRLPRPVRQPPPHRADLTAMPDVDDEDGESRSADWSKTG